MGLFPPHFVDDVRLQANIVQIVQEYVTLRRAGARYKGLCPFHAEKTPSFTVDPDKGFFYCFGCHAGGDVFKFVELQERVGFQDAVRLLAQKLGIPVPDAPDSSTDDARREAALRETLLRIHEAAADFFRDALAGPAGARARRQLAERGLEASTIERLGLGYAPAQPGALKAFLVGRGFSEPALLTAGLLVKRDSGAEVERFRNRLMVPICRETGSIVAFGGRAVDPDQAPKYLNSPETPIYSKARTLYGLHLTKGEMREKGFAVLVEGYFDFAQVFQSGVAPAVASCGTALTPQQARLLRRFTTRVVLSYDPDAAGQLAAERSCRLLVEEGFDVNVAVMDRGEDPDAFIRRHGPERYRERLRRSRPYLEYLLDQAAAGLDLGQDEQRRQFLGRMLAVAAWIPDPAARDQFGDRLAHKAQITEEVVRAEIRKAAVARRAAVTERELPTFGALKPAETDLIWALIHNADEAARALTELEPEDVNHLATREILELARTLHEEQGRLVPAALLARLGEGQAQLVTRIAARENHPAPPLACVYALKRLRLRDEGAAIQREIDRLQGLGAGQNGREINALWQRKKDLLHRIEELT